MDWLIATPDLCARYEGGEVSFEPGRSGPEIGTDDTEELWTTYFRNIFNPARLKVKAMQSEMPKKYWRNMPETRAIPELIAQARVREQGMCDAAPTQAPAFARAIKERAMPVSTRLAPGSLDALRAEASGCTRCSLHAMATQVVFGEGPRDAELMFVGEQPGDQEDLAGRPFVGPAGQLFDALLQDAGIDRNRVYVTNAVKHFKFAPRGKRRIHSRPDSGEIQACRWWLDAERSLVSPTLIVALGATATEALTGTGKGILKRRGGIEAGPDATPVFVTVHPSYLLRLPSEIDRTEAKNGFVADLQAAFAHLEGLRGT